MPVATLTQRIRYFVTNNGTNEVLEVEGLSNSIIKRIPVGDGPEDLRLGNNNELFSANDRSETVSVICDGIVRTFQIPNNGHIFVDSVFQRIYAANNTVVGVYDSETGAPILPPFGGFTNARPIAVDRSGLRLIVADSGTNQIKIFNTLNQQLLATILTPPTTYNYILVSQDNTTAFVSSSIGIFVINLAVNPPVLQSTITSGLSNPIGMVQKGNILYVVSNGNNQVVPIFLPTGTAGTPIPVGTGAQRIALTPDGLKLIVTNFTAGTLSVIDLTTNTVVTVPGFNKPIDVVALLVGDPLSPGDPIDLTDPYQLDDIKESVCIITDKVFAACQQRACFKNVVVELPDKNCNFQSIKFGNGIIVSGTEKRTPIPSRPNFSRVRFALRIPFTVKCTDCDGKKVTVNGFLEDILKDIVMFIPQTRDEFDLDLVVETRSELLGNVIVSDNKVTFNVGVFIVVKIVGKVQLLIPAFGYCPEPVECEEFIEPIEEDICVIFKDFNLTPFPEDFFPPQLEDLECN